MRRVLCVFIVSLFCFGSISTGSGFPKQLHIGKQQDYPPYIFEKEGKTVGVCAEIAEQAFALLGISVTYTQYPFVKMLQYGQSGEVDAIMLVFKTRERESYLYYPDNELYYEENSFFTKKNAEISYSGDLEDLKEYIIGVINGFSYGEAFDNSAHLKRDLSVNDEILLSKLMEDQFRIAVGNKYVISYHAERMGVLNEIEFLKPNLFDRNPLYIGFSKSKPGNRELTVKFSEALVNLKRTGQYQNILKKYNLEMLEEEMKK